MQRRKRILPFLLLLLSLVLSNAIIASAVPGVCVSTGPGSCLLQISSTGTTNYDTAGGGSIVQQPSTAQPSPLPLISDVLNQNSNDAQWLVTCPVQPNPSDTLEYFTTDAQSFIAGDRCLADKAPLATNATVQVPVAWNATTPATASTISFALSGVASGEIDNLAYSGMTDKDGQGNYNLSSSYDSVSYIFGQVPPSTQQGIWTWHAKYADLSKIDLTPLQQDQTLSLQLSVPYSNTTTTTTCTTTTVACPLQNNDSLTFTNSASIIESYSPFQQSSMPQLGLVGTCAQALYEYDALMGIPPDIPDSCPFTTWTRVSTDGELKLPTGENYTALNVYTRADQPNTYWVAYRFQSSTDALGDPIYSYQAGNVSSAPCSTTTCTSTNTTYDWTCSYNYDYKVNAHVSQLGNAQIPIPEQTASAPKNDYLSLEIGRAHV